MDVYYQIEFVDGLTKVNNKPTADLKLYEISTNIKKAKRDLPCNSCGSKVKKGDSFLTTTKLVSKKRFLTYEYCNKCFGEVTL